MMSLPQLAQDKANHLLYGLLAFTGKGQIPRPVVRVANVSGAIGVLVRDYQGLIGAKFTRKRTSCKSGSCLTNEVSYADEHKIVTIGRDSSRVFARHADVPQEGVSGSSDKPENRESP